MGKTASSFRLLPLNLILPSLLFPPYPLFFSFTISCSLQVKKHISAERTFQKQLNSTILNRLRPKRHVHAALRRSNCDETSCVERENVCPHSLWPLSQGLQKTLRVYFHNPAAGRLSHAEQRVIKRTALHDCRHICMQRVFRRRLNVHSFDCAPGTHCYI